MAEAHETKFRHPELPPLPEEKPKPTTVWGHISSVVSSVRSYISANRYSEGLTQQVVDDIIRLYRKEVDARKATRPPGYFESADNRVKVLDEVLYNGFYELVQNKPEMTVHRIRMQLQESAGLIPALY